MSDADVLVVGCGPVGVMTALRCAQRGLRVIAVDRSREIYPLPRAIGMDDEIQTLFGRAGLDDEVRACSRPLPGAEFVDATGERVVGIEFPDGELGPLGRPRTIMFDQPGLERALRAAAVAAGVDLRLGVDAQAVTDTHDGVELRTDTGSLTARWLVAADGAKSTVRALRDIAMVDQGFDQTWLVVDVTVEDAELRLPRLAQQICDPTRVCTFVPGPARHRRWEFQLHPNETREQMLEPTTIATLLSRWGTTDQLTVDRAAVYRFHATVAATFRDGPVFLAGDAAHQMPPFNGQGMCSGMRDAENFAWKLAAVHRGDAGPRLLDTYDAERRDHATRQVTHSADAGRLIQAIAHDGEAALDAGYGRRPFPRVRGELFAGDHPRVGAPIPTSAIDDTSLPDGWLVLSTHELTLDARWPATVVVLPATALPGLLDDERTVVVRPDRLVAAVTADPSAALEAFGPLLDRPVATHPNLETPA